MNDELEADLKESGSGLNEALSRNLAIVTEESHGKPR
jgi:hypothetical protein